MPTSQVGSNSPTERPGSELLLSPSTTSTVSWYSPNGPVPVGNRGTSESSSVFVPGLGPAPGAPWSVGDPVWSAGDT